MEQNGFKVSRVMPISFNIKTLTYLLTIVCGSVLFCGGCDGQVFFPGTCPPQTVIQNFDVIKYLGRWYENRNYFAWFQKKGICVTATYSFNTSNPNVVGVLNEGTKNGKPSVAEGMAVIVDPSKMEGKLRVSFDSNPFASKTTNTSDDGNYWILDTDYTSYSIVWTCNQKSSLYNNQYLWILTRERFPPLALLDQAYKTIHVRGLDTRALEVTEQRNCPA